MQRIAQLVALLLTFPLAHAAPNITSNPVQTHDVSPGATFEGNITIENTGQHPVGVRAYLTDYHVTPDGDLQFAEAGTSERSNANWITVNGPSTRTVPPGQEITITYTGIVPDTHVAGAYWAMLMIEDAAPDDTNAPTAQEGQTQVGLTTRTRRANYIITNTGNNQPHLTFTNAEVLQANQNETSSPQLLVDLRNTGNTLSSPEVNLEVFHSSYGAVHEQTHTPSALLPGAEETMPFNLAGLEPGNYRAVLIADNGDDDVFGIQYRFAIE